MGGQPNAVCYTARYSTVSISVTRHVDELLRFDTPTFAQAKGGGAFAFFCLLAFLGGPPARPKLAYNGPTPNDVMWRYGFSYYHLNILIFTCPDP